MDCFKKHSRKNSIPFRLLVFFLQALIALGKGWHTTTGTRTIVWVPVVQDIVDLKRCKDQSFKHNLNCFGFKELQKIIHNPSRFVYCLEHKWL